MRVYITLHDARVGNQAAGIQSVPEDVDRTRGPYQRTVPEDEDFLILNTKSGF